MLLKNGRVLQIKEKHVFFESLDIRISDSYITECSPNLSPQRGEVWMDLDQDFVIPGIINSHYHSYATLLKGTSSGAPLEIWSPDTIALGAALTPEDMALSAAISICEMLHAGVTACIDHIPHIKAAAAIANVYQKAGFRVLLAPMLHDITDSQILYHVPAAPGAFPSVSEYYNFYTNFISQFHRPDGTSQVMVGINSPQRASHELLELAHFLSETYDLNIHCHLLETKWQKLSAQISKEEPLKKLTDHSLLSNKTSLAHCIWLDDKDLQLISYNHAYIVANPESNCFLGSGILPLRQIKRYGIPVAIGSDAGNCGANHNLISSLRLLLQLDRIQDYTNESGKNLISFQDYHDWYSMAEGFSMLSQTAASLAGYSNLGSIAPGFLADLVTFDKKALVNTGENFLLQQFIFHSSFHAKEVFIHGKHILKHGTITCLDENELYQKLEQRLPALRGLIANALKETCTKRELYDRMYSSFHD